MNDPLLVISDLSVEVAGKTVLGAVNLTVKYGEVHVLMGQNGSGKSTLAHVLAGKSEYVVTAGAITFAGNDLLAQTPTERAHSGIFLAFQQPVSIPGLSNITFLHNMLNQQRKLRQQPELDAREFLQLVNAKAATLGLNQQLLRRGVNDGFSGGEKKRNEVLQMMLLEPQLAILDELDSGLDIDALQMVAAGVNAMRSAERSLLLITHYERLLQYIKPDVVHILAGGRIVASGGMDLVAKLEAQGYSWLHREMVEE